MRAGPLRHRVTVQSSSSAADGFGQPQPTWGSVGEYWANVEPLVGREAERARQVRADATHRVTMRIPVTITTAHRLVFESTRTLNVAQVLNVGERDREQRLVCVEILSGGQP